MDHGLVAVLAELYARVFEKSIHHTCPSDGDHETRRKAASTGIALARAEAEKAIKTVTQAAKTREEQAK